MAWWDNVLDAVSRIGDWLAGDRDDIPEETDDEPGGFFGGEEPPEEPPGSAGFGSDDDSEYYHYEAGEGPYPEDWGDAEIRFWDRIAGDHTFWDENNYNRAQEQFELGFIDQDIDSDDRIEAREEFLEEMLWNVMDWDAFEDYYNET